MTSAVAVYETVAAVARTVRGDVVAARRDVAKFLIDVGITLVPIGLAEQEVALDAFDRYGKGRHPAELNMGDCFAYACARTRGRDCSTRAMISPGRTSAPRERMQAVVIPA